MSETAYLIEVGDCRAKGDAATLRKFALLLNGICDMATGSTAQARLDSMSRRELDQVGQSAEQLAEHEEADPADRVDHLADRRCRECNDVLTNGELKEKICARCKPEVGNPLPVNTGKRDCSETLAVFRKHRQVNAETLVKALGITKCAAYARLNHMLGKGLIRNVSRGLYELIPEDE